MSRFDTTRWSIVLQTRGRDRSARTALEALCRMYRAPVLAYIRSRGYRDDAAEDLTQSFFAMFLERGDFATADPALGSFRAYLLTAVRRFLINADASSQRVKRGGRIRIESLDTDSLEHGPSPACGEDPERVFEQSWALTVISAALGNLREEARRAGKAELFERLRDFLTEQPTETEYERVATALRMRRNTVAVSVHRLRQRLRELVHQEVAQTAADREAFKRELRGLRAALGQAAPQESVA